MNKIERVLISIPVFLGIIYLFYRAGLFISNLNIKEPDPNYDIHGYPAIIFGIILTPLIEIPTKFIKTGKFEFFKEEVVTVPSNEPPGFSAPGPGGLSSVGLKTWLILMLLTVFWSLISLYCNLLLSTVSAMVTDPKIISPDISKIDADELMSSIGGVLYFGIFFPLMAASSFLAGWLSKQRLSYRMIIIPALLFYSFINYLGYRASGELKVVHAIRQMIRALLKESPANTESYIHTALIWFIALCAFLVIVAGLTLFGWAWCRIGRYANRRMYQIA